MGFLGLALNNVLACVDLALLPSIDLVMPRTIVETLGMTVVLYGLIRSSDP